MLKNWQGWKQLTLYDFSEKRVHFYCDNCSSQDKNRFLMFYVHDVSDFMWPAWRYQGIFLPFIGRTKFSSDWCFGLLKQHFNRSKVGCLDDIVWIVNESATPSVAQLVVSQSGDVIVSSYFEETTVKTALKGITWMHCFHFSQATLQKWTYATLMMTGKSSNYLDFSWRPSNLPQQLVPPGLSLERDSSIYMTILGSSVLKTAETWFAQSQHSHCHKHVLLCTHKYLHSKISNITHANTYHLTLPSFTNHNSSVQWVGKAVNCQIKNRYNKNQGKFIYSVTNPTARMLEYLLMLFPVINEHSM